MKTILEKLFRKTENPKTTAKVKTTVISATPPAEGIDNLIKMKEAMRLIKASAPTVRKYARLGYYKEYRFGEKLVFYNKEEMLNFILSGGDGKR